MRSHLKNSARLVRFMIRRELVMSAVWLVLLLAFSVALAAGMPSMFTAEARQALTVTLQNPGMVAMMGPVYGADNYTVGAMYNGMTLLWVVITVAVMNIFLAVRHTRADEEKGRAEVVRSLPVGRLSILNAAMVTALAVNATLALLTGFGLAAAGVESMDFGGSMLYGATLGVSGLLFAAIAALFAQLCASSRGASGLSLLTLGGMYMLRAAGDLGAEALSLISPMGLIQRAQAYVQNNWWPVLIVLLEAAAVTGLAYALNARRDIEQGLIPTRPGRSHASAALRSSFGLWLRLLRGPLLAWLITMLVIGVSYGSILGDIDTFIAESEFYQKMIGANDQHSNAEMFTATAISIGALFCAIPGLSTVLKLRSEEQENRAEHVLSRVVSRTKYLTGPVTLAFAASVLFQIATAFGLYVSANAVLDEHLSFGFLMKANLVYLPALWVMIGVAVALTGLLPKMTGVAWGYFGGSFAAAFIGRVMTFPDWLTRLTPFVHIPQLPTETIHYGTLAILTGLAALLTFVGFFFYRRRDVTP